MLSGKAEPNILKYLKLKTKNYGTKRKRNSTDEC
jgi:hypothetical protein